MEVRDLYDENRNFTGETIYKGEEIVRKLNLIVVFSNDLNKSLFCIRAKELYKGI